MKEKHLIWQEFVDQSNRQLVKTLVDIRKGHELLKTSVAFSHSRLNMDTLNYILVFSILSALVLFTLNILIIPILITVFTLIAFQAFREEASKAIIRNALKNEAFYYRAVNSSIIRVLAV
jgi:hypothetical protein